MMRKLLPALAFAGILICHGTAAEAGPVVAAIGAIFTSGSLLTQIVGRLLISIAASSLLKALAPKPRSPGIRTEITQNGGINPCAFVLMSYATAGQRVCPPMSHGTDGKTPNAYLTEIIELGDIPGQTLTRVMINDQYVTLGTTSHPEYGLPVLGDLNGFAWVKYYDGTQTAADPMLIGKYGSYPERPWTADMIGRGLCYAILTCRFSREKWNSMPRFRFEVGGIPLYDPRKDSTVGGSGAQRWTNKATWTPTTNPVVAIYNILRGIELPDGSVWGGGIPASDLPLASWFAGMNACDLPVDNGEGGTEPQYRAGLEVAVDEQPADIIDELLKACSGEISEAGGVWKIRIGGPGLPILSITDGDILISKPQDLNPFPGFTSSFNGIHATYPEPRMLWEPKEAPPIYNATLEAQDQGQRLIADLALPAVPYGAQVRRVMEAYIKEERRFLRHGMTLPPDAALIEPLDTLAWTSTANGYAGKVFEIAEVVDDLWTCQQTVALRERDAADYVNSAPAAPEVPSLVVVIPPAQLVPSFAVTAVAITDATSANRRPALRLSWEPELDDVRGILWEVRLLATGTVIASGSTANVAAGQLTVSEGILASTTYQARAKPVVDRAADWTAWVSATTAAVLITAADIATGAVSDQVEDFDATERNFSALPVNTELALITIPTAGRPWIFVASFDISRTNGGAGTFTVQLQERLGLPPILQSFTTIETWNVMNDGLPGSTLNFWPRFTSRILAGSFGSRVMRLIVSANTGSPAGRIRNVLLTATRVTK